MMNNPQTYDSDTVSRAGLAIVFFAFSTLSFAEVRAQSALSCIPKQQICQSSCSNDRYCINECYEEAQRCIRGDQSEAARPRSREYSSESYEDRSEREETPSYSPRQAPSYSAPSRPAAYPAASCVEIGQNSYNGGQVLRNHCAFDAEIHWLDTEGGWNAWSVRSGGEYRGGMKAVRAYACIRNHLLDKQTLMCRP